MDDIRKERLMISIISISAISSIAQSFIAGWEYWVPPLIIFGMAAMWWIHISGKVANEIRTTSYFIFASLLVFYFGVHENMAYDMSVVMMLFMATFTMLDNIGILNLILMEYALIAVIQGYLMAGTWGSGMNGMEIMRALLHVGSVLSLYLFSRITINGRLREKDRIDKWKETVNENGNDMEDFLSNISHELRTPVNVISGMTTIMQKNDDSKELKSIRAAGIRLAHQIEDIQDYTEIKRGELILEEDKYMCISLINDVVANYKAAGNKKDLEFIIDLAPETPSVLKGDITKLHKLFRHLLDNAIKFTKRGGIYIKVFSVPQEYGVNLTIEVTDTGIGMTRAAISHISKGMYQANKKRNRSTGGIGIGLPIVYGFVHKMGGFVKISSTRGKGTTVRLCIPQEIVDPKPCLFVEEGAYEGIVFYIKPEKYKVPEVRDFYRDMAVHLATGLKARLYSASEERELIRLTEDLNISHIFAGREEYEADKDILNRLAGEGYKVVVSADEGFSVPKDSKVTVIEKPLYAFPVVRILNGDHDGENRQGEGKIRFTGVSALVVDDEPMNLVVATGLLKEYKMFADTAESGSEAIAKYKNGEYDVIFMDHMMPEMDGVEAMRRIRQEADGTGRKPIMIALTANALSGAKEVFIREGFDGFIAKPIDVAEFERVMRRVLPEEMIRNEGRVEA
ncbi:MAG: response regulator [Lachnospiraceae bacterium]|nr:response regulator [Lachnospiraceae bacterium]